MGMSCLQKTLHQHVKQLIKAKGCQDTLYDPTLEHATARQETRSGWPHLVSEDLKDKIGSLFHSETSANTLREAVCASCAEVVLLSSGHTLPSGAINLNILKAAPGDDDSSEGSCFDDGSEKDNSPYFVKPGLIPPDLPNLPGAFENLMVHPDGLIHNGDNKVALRLCPPCSCSINHNQMPRCALANCTFLGNVPDILKGLTFIEESAIALCHAKAYIVQLKGDTLDGRALPNLQRGIKGHVIIYPQKASIVALKSG
jgi:hypothetical protein